MRYKQKLWIVGVREAAYPYPGANGNTPVAAWENETPSMLKVIDNEVIGE
jgi:hypothetical protein